MRNLLALATLIFSGAIVVFCAVLLSKDATGDRDWKVVFSKVASFTPTADGKLTLTNRRIFIFDDDGNYTPAWDTIEVDPSTIQRMWYFIEPFESNAAFGHSFLSFEFVDGNGKLSTLTISIEARQTNGQTYSALNGAFRAYELQYIWASEKDIMTRIAVGLDHPLHAYALNIPPQQAREIFAYFVRRTNRIAEKPTFLQYPSFKLHKRTRQSRE